MEEYRAKPQPETLQAACDALLADGLKYQAEFVPFSKSRNAKKPPVKPSDYSLNWRITISKGRQWLVTDYSVGIAHIPGYKQTRSGRLTVDEFDAIKRACETGHARDSAHRIAYTKIPAPELHDVLYSLVMDGSAIDAGSFEEWAGDFGYDTDSREAERTYKACLEHGLKLRAMLGDAGFRALQDATQGY